MNMNRRLSSRTMGLLLASVLLLGACQNNTATSDTSASTGTQFSRNSNAAANTTATPLPTRAVVAAQSIAVDGQVTLASPLVTVGFESTGKVTAINVTPGQSVKKGDVLAEIDGITLKNAVQTAQEALVLKQAQIDSSLSPSTKSSIDSAKAALASAYASYKTLKAGPTADTVEQALRSWNEAKNSLYSAQLNRDQMCGFSASTPKDERVLPNNPKCKAADLAVQSSDLNERDAYRRYQEAQAPTAQADLASSWANVLQAQAGLSSAQNNVTTATKKVYELQLADAQLSVERAQRDLAQAKLISPCDCTVQTVDLTIGAGAGDGVTLLDTSKLQFHTTNLSEQDVVTGQTAEIRLKAFTQIFTGTVEATLPITSGTQGTSALYTAIIAIDPAGATLLPGMTGQAEIRLK